MGLYHLVVYERSLQVQVVIKSKQHAHLRLVHTGLQRTLKNKYFANMCTPIIDGHAALQYDLEPLEVARGGFWVIKLRPLALYQNGSFLP